jgi:hypothetical protein
VEIATSAESIAGTDTGETGALNSVLPSDIAKNTQSCTFVYWTDVGWDDTYVVALTPTLTAYTAGQRLNFKPTTANTGACTVDFWPSVLNIKTKDGNDPQSGVIRANVEVSGCYDGTNFVLDTEDFATTANKGTVELATDAEANTGTSTTLVPTVSQLPKYKNGSTTRAGQTASGTQTIAHWLWVIPKNIRISTQYLVPANAITAYAQSFGAYNWTDQNCTYMYQNSWAGGTSGESGVSSTQIIKLASVATWTPISQVAVATFDATNITLTWTKTSSGMATNDNINIFWEAQK